MSNADRQSGETTLFVPQNVEGETATHEVLPCEKAPEASPGAAPETRGGIIDRYELLAEIGRGGMGEVFHAHDRVLKRPVAIKVLLLRHQAEPRLKRRFVEEAQIMGDLQHPGVAPIFDLGEFDDGRPFFAMKLLNGCSLLELLSQRSHPREDLPRYLRILEHVSQTIAYAHTQGIVHCDLKPLNIMIGVFGEVIVIDWGLARRLESPGNAREEIEAFNLQGEIAGTIEYLAPEQLTETTWNGDERTDVFGLGAILCEVLTGKPPYSHERPKEVMQLALKTKLGPARERLKHCGLPREIVQLALDCLQADPTRRPPDAGTVANILGRYLDASLRAAESDLGRFFEFSQDLFCIAGLDGYFRRVNSNFTRVLGYSEDQLLSHPFMDFVHPDDHAATLQAVEQLAANTPLVDFCNRYRDAFGRYRTLEWSAKSIPEEGIIFAVAREQRALSS